MTTTAYISHPVFARHDMGPGHPECAHRLDVIQDRLVAAGLMDFMPPHDAPAARDAELLHAHGARHLAELAALAPRDGMVQVDPDTRMNPHTLTAARHAAGAGILAVDLVMGGRSAQNTRRAFCAVRPPGHHATREQAMGFCFFNNAAVAVRHAQRAHGVTRVALVDFDAHHGNGSEDILAGDEGVLMASTFERGLYPFPDESPIGGNLVNVPLPARSGGEAMRAAVRDHWLPALDAFRPTLVVVSAGFDAHRDDDMSTLCWTAADFAWITARIVEVADRHAGGRIVSLLEGGYDLRGLADGVAAHVGVLAGAVDA